MAFIKSRSGIIALALITAAIHLALGIGQGNSLFILNGLGYAALLYASFWTPAFLKGQSGLIRWAFIGYTALTIILYFASWGLDGFLQPIGLLTKLVEALLIAGLWQTRSA